MPMTFIDPRQVDGLGFYVPEIDGYCLIGKTDGF
jgi:hypothetical protein